MYCVYRLREVNCLLSAVYVLCLQAAGGQLFIECCVCTVFTGCGKSRCLLNSVYVLCLQAVGGQCLLSAVYVLCLQAVGGQDVY